MMVFFALNFLVCYCIGVGVKLCIPLVHYLCMINITVVIKTSKVTMVTLVKAEAIRIHLTLL